MTDLSKNELRLMDLPREDQLAICEAWLDGRLDVMVPFNTDRRALSKYGVYRIPAREPEYPWHMLPPQAKFCGQDRDGRVFWSSHKPKLLNVHWGDMQRGVLEFMPDWLKFERGDVAWQDSLRERPEGV